MVESLLLTCLQAHFLVTRVQVHTKLTWEQKKELIAEVRQITKRECRL